jgi:integral membrane protein
MTIGILEKFERMQPFTDKEAWTLFKIAAIGEAVGWSLLISGILFKHYVTPSNDTAVRIAGEIHGMLFLVYAAAAIVLYSSLHWSRKRTIIATLASVPPYGSLLFEQWAAYKRRSEALKTYREIIVRAIIIKNTRLLAIQPKETGFWNLPGGVVRAKESAEQAVARIVSGQTGVTPTIGQLTYIVQYHHKSSEGLEMFFTISNAADFSEDIMKTNLEKTKVLDDIAYIEATSNTALRPAFLQNPSFFDVTKTRGKQVLFIHDAS